MLAEIMRHVLYRKRVNQARAWSDAARRDAAARSEAIRQIIAQELPDPAGRRGAR